MGCLPSGSTISHYTIKELIASGGMGEVYKATDTQLGRMVALKTLLPVLAAEPKSRLRFMQEARTASGLSHPSICTVFEVGQEGDFSFIAMQYVEGKTIQEILAEGPLPIDTALGYAVQIAEALEEAHAHGIIHRDIKPSNIIIDERGRAVVLDFGLAKLIQSYSPDDQDSPTVELLTTSPQVIGTTAYMSPEQIRSEEVDQRSDVFSFGVLLYETLSGTRPFKGKSKIDVLHAVLYDQPAPVRELRSEIESELEVVIVRALQKNRDLRYQSITDLKLDLVKLIQERGRLASGASTQPIDSSDNDAVIAMQSNRYIRWRSSTIAFAAIALLAIIAAIASWRLLRSGNQTTDLQSSLRIVPLANWKNEPGSNVGEQSFSRDGAMIAYTSNKDGGYNNIYITQAAGNSETIRVTTNKANDTSPIWSPHNEQIAFASDADGQRSIWVVGILGGTPKLIKTLESGKLSLRYWSKDGSTIYYDWRANLYSMSLDTKETKQITNLDASMNAGDYSVSPAEDQICYVARQNGQLDIWVMPLLGNMAPLKITDDDAEDRYPVWHPDGQRIIYSSNRGGTFQICLAYLDGRKPAQITFGENDSLVTSISPDGAKILYSGTKDDADLWRVDLEANKESQLTADVGVELWPDPSPNGDMMAYQATSGPNIGGLRIFKCLIMAKPLKVDGRAVQMAIDGFDPRWSPDGGSLAFLRRTGNEINIFTVQANATGEKQITQKGILQGGFSVLPAFRAQPRDYCWSPDGTKLAYGSVTGNRSDVWMISADGANETKLSDERAQDSYFSPLWSHNGHNLAYIGRLNVKTVNDKRGWRIWIAQLGESVSIYETDSALRLLGWSKSDNEVIAAFVEHARERSMASVDVTVVQISVLDGATQTLARLKSAYLANLQLSPDGQKLAFTSRQNGVDNIWVQPVGGGEARRVTSNTDARTFISNLAWAPDGKAIYFGKQSSFNLISILDNFR